MNRPPFRPVGNVLMGFNHELEKFQIFIHAGTCTLTSQLPVENEITLMLKAFGG